MGFTTFFTQLQAHPERTDVAPLVDLAEAIRPRDPAEHEVAVAALAALSLHLRNYPQQAAALRRYILNLLAPRRHLHLYTETGILTNEGFFSTLRKRIAHRFLPDEVRDDYLRDLFSQVFHVSTDYEWIALVPDAVWGELLEQIDFDAEADHPGFLKLRSEVLEAVQVLSYRIAAVGLEPELVRNYPGMEDFASPFLAQNAEVREYYENCRKLLAGAAVELDDRHIRVLLAQCVEVLDKVRRLANHNGASISLTYHLQRCGQMIARLDMLFNLLDPAHANIRRTAALELLRDLVREDNRKYSVRDVVRRATDLVALQITENASRTGEHYAAVTRSEYFSMMRSAAGAGFIVGFMGLIKILIGKVTLAPLVQAFANSMNYSFGFILIHVLHFTVATKQPAMTAATIAQTVEESTEKKRAALDELAGLVVVILRTQFLAIVSNVMVAVPTSIVIALALSHWFGMNPVTPEKALATLHTLDPFSTLALLHAATAGVCLFVAGLISGYYDNRCSYNRIPQRLQQLRWLGALLGDARRTRFAGYIENNMGALAGNFFLGILLGTTGMVGFMLGIPLDVLHVTLSSASAAYAIVGLDFNVSALTVLVTCVGVGLVGMMNLGVSFSLALIVALKSRRVRFTRSGELLLLLWQRFRTRPRDFFLPPPKETAVPQQMAM